MQLFVKVNPDNRTVIIDIDSSDDVTLISELVFAQLNINPETDLVNNPAAGTNGYRLVMLGKTLEAGRTLSDYNIQKDSDFNIVLILNRKSTLEKVFNRISNFSFWNSQPQQVPAAAIPVPAVVEAQASAPAVAPVPAAVMPVNYNLSEQVDLYSDIPDTSTRKPSHKQK